MGHTSNIHDFSAFTHFKRCEHGELGGVRRPWFQEGSPPHIKLGKILYGEDCANLKDLIHMTG